MAYDLIVAGAGPGGATAAATAAAAGLKVLLVDQARFPRDKVCGDAISGKSVDVLRRLDLLDRLECVESLDSWGVLFASPGGHEVEIPFGDIAHRERPPGYVCARETFDHLLVERAVELGAELRESTRASGPVMANEKVCGLRISRNGRAEEIRAPFVVGADGAYSAVARGLGMAQLDEQHYYGAVRAYYDGVDGFRRRNFIELHFLDDVIPGYFWIFPMKGGRANVGLGTLSARIKSRGLRLKEVLEKVLASPRFRDRFAGARRIGKVVGWGMPLGSRMRKPAGPGWMLVGDAASLIDPFTGEGIGNAMVTGELAARCSEEALNGSMSHDVIPTAYTEAVHEALGAELRLSQTLRRLESRTWLLNVVIRKAARRPEIANAISGMFDDLSERRKLASPMFYLRLLRA